MNYTLLIDCIILSVLCGALSIFIKCCLQPDMLFGRYGTYLQFLHIRKAFTEKELENNEVLMNFDKVLILERKLTKLERWIFILKPLGGCVYCYSTWINIVAYTYFITSNYEYLVLTIGVQYVIVYLLNTLIYKKCVD